MEQVITPLVLAIAQIVIPLFFTWVAGWLGVIVKQYYSGLVARVGLDRLLLVEQVVRSAVLQAEQNGLRGMIENDGAAKKAAAITYIQDQLKALGLGWFPIAQVSDMVEAAVLENLNFQKLTKE